MFLKIVEFSISMVKQGELSDLLRADSEHPIKTHDVLGIHSAAHLLYPNLNYTRSNDGGDLFIFTREKPFETFLESERKAEKFGFTILYYKDKNLLSTVVGESPKPVDQKTLEDMANLFIDNVIHEQDNVFFPAELNPRNIGNYMFPSIIPAMMIGAIGYLTYSVGIDFGAELITTPISAACALIVVMIARNTFIAASLGKRTDEIREEGFPKIAYECFYGEQARNILLAEKAELDRNNGMTNYSQRLEETGMPVSKQAVAELYAAFSGRDTINHLVSADLLDPNVSKLGLKVLAREYVASEDM